MEENGQFNTYMNVLLGAKSFDDLLSRVDVLTEIMENDKRLEQKYKDTRDEAIRVKQEYEELNVQLEAKKAELEAEVEQLKKEIAEADEMIAEIQKDIDKYTALYNQAAASEAAVMNQINQILADIAAAEDAARKEAEEAARREEEQQGQLGDGATADGGNTGGGEGGGVQDGGDSSDTPQPEAPPASSGPATGTYIWPTPSSRLITSLYGNRMHPILGYERYHSGVDINGSVGDPVVAADGGTVILSSYDPGGYGNYVVISHGGGRTTLYAHMSSVAVSVGNVVSQGQTIAYVGSTGLSTGPHLHFEIAVNGTRHDPLSYLGGYTIWEKAT